MKSTIESNFFEISFINFLSILFSSVFINSQKILFEMYDREGLLEDLECHSA